MSLSPSINPLAHLTGSPLMCHLLKPGVPLRIELPAWALNSSRWSWLLGIPLFSPLADTLISCAVLYGFLMVCDMYVLPCLFELGMGWLYLVESLGGFRGSIECVLELVCYFVHRDLSV